jgi:hypothetical protein
MTIFTAGAPDIVIPAKAGIHIYCLNRRKKINLVLVSKLTLAYS